MVGDPEALGRGPGSNNRNGIVVDFRHDRASYSPQVSMESKGLNSNLRGVTDEAAGLGSGKLAGQLFAGRKVSSTTSPAPQALDTIDFPYEALWKDKDFLHQKYVLEGLSIAQIATQILSSRAAVRTGLIESGIKRKGQGKPGLRPAQVPYGYRLSNGVTVPHFGEQRVVLSIRKMSEDGLSYRKICEFLTSVGVPTKNRGRSWHPEMIRRILNR